MLTNSTSSTSLQTAETTSPPPDHELKTSESLGKLTPTSDRKLTHLSLSVYQSMRALSISEDINKTIEGITHRQILQKLPTEVSQNKIRKEIAQRIDQLQQHHLPFNLTEKIKLFSELHQKYIDEHQLDFYEAEEITDFISEEILDNEDPGTNNNKNKKEELEDFLAKNIKNSTNSTYEKLEKYLKENNITTHTKCFDQTRGDILFIVDQQSSEFIKSLKPTRLKEFIEELYTIDFKTFIENFLLNQAAPELFKEIISEEIELYTKENPGRTAVHFLTDTPSSASFFIQNAIHFHMNKEQALSCFMKSFLFVAKQTLADQKHADPSNKSTEQLIEFLLSQYPYIEKLSPRLFNYLKNSTEKAIENGVYISKKDFGLENTLIICAHTFDAYALTNTLSTKDMMNLKQKHAEMGLPEITNLNQKLKYIIGEGGFGKVRFARNITTGNYVAVKKIAKPEAAQSEVDSYLAIGKGKNLVSLYNHAAVINKTDQKKAYLFIEFVQGGDGKKYLDKIKNNPDINAQLNPKDAQELKRVAKEYLYSAAALHANGVFHRDIKPENFLHATNGDIKIIDYGLYTKNPSESGAGTLSYMCPEIFPQIAKQKKYEYHAQKHDSFSLGICLMKQTHAFEKKDARTKLVDSDYHEFPVKHYLLPMRGKKVMLYAGFENTASLAGRNIDEIIMKLMDKDPAQRITADEALQLLYSLEEVARQPNPYDDVD